MVSVTSKNFDEALLSFKDKLASCSFVAFDEEMTGIRLDEAKPSFADSSDTRYEKMKKVASTFSLVQVGFCLFHEQSDGSFLGTPFNFFVFPSASSKKIIQLDVSAAHFLSSNNLDFNTWVKEGIPFLRNDEYEAIYKEITTKKDKEEDLDLKKQRKVTIDKAADKAFVGFYMQRLEAWVESLKREGKVPVALPQVDGDGDAEDGKEAMDVDGASAAAPAAESTEENPEGTLASAEVEGEVDATAPVAEKPITDGKDADGGKDEAEKADAEVSTDPPPASTPSKEESHVFAEPTITDEGFLFPECNAYLRKALYEEIGEKYPYLRVQSRQIVEKSRLKSLFASLAPDSSILDGQLADLEKASGFRRAYTLVVEAKKPIVGHNCLYDLLFLFSHFESDLPAKYSTWKETLHNRFPAIFDTKVISKDSPFKDDTMLGNIYKASMEGEGPVVKPDPASEAYVTNSGKHEAGYDAWMTGATFLRLGGRKLLDDLEAKPCNTINTMSSLSLVNLAGEDIPIEGAILHLSDFPKETVTSDLIAVFGKPLHVQNIPSSASSAEFQAELEKHGKLRYSLLVPGEDGKLASGFVAFESAEHAEAAIKVVDGAQLFGAKDEDAKLKCSTLRSVVRWVDDSSAFLVLPDCNSSDGLALLDAQPKGLPFTVMTLEEYHSGAHGHAKGGKKKGRVSGASAKATATPEKAVAGRKTPAQKSKKRTADDSAEEPPAKTARGHEEPEKSKASASRRAPSKRATPSKKEEGSDEKEEKVDDGDDDKGEEERVDDAMAVDGKDDKDDKEEEADAKSSKKGTKGKDAVTTPAGGRSKRVAVSAAKEETASPAATAPSRRGRGRASAASETKEAEDGKDEEDGKEEEEGEEHKDDEEEDEGGSKATPRRGGGKSVKPAKGKSPKEKAEPAPAPTRRSSRH